MEQAQRISALRARSLKVGLSLRRLSERAGVKPSTLSRWERTDADPRMKLFESSMARLEQALVAREREVLAELAERHPDLIGKLAA